MICSFTQDVEYSFSCSHHAPPHRTRSHSFTCLPSPCEWLSHFPWSVVTTTSTMETPYPYDSHHLGHPVFRFTISVVATLRLPSAHPYPASLADSPHWQVPTDVVYLREGDGRPNKHHSGFYGVRVSVTFPLDVVCSSWTLGFLS